MQADHARILTVSNKGKAAQMRKRGPNTRKLESRALTVLRNVILRDLDIVEQGKPAPDEARLHIFTSESLSMRHHPSTARMAEHDDVRHFQHQCRIFNGRARAVIAALRLIGRYKIGDVAQDEQSTWLGIKDCGNVDASVTTSNHHRGRRLPKLGELQVAPLFGRVPVAQETPMSLQ